MNFPAAPSARACGGVASNHPYLLATPSSLNLTTSIRFLSLAFRFPVLHAPESPHRHSSVRELLSRPRHSCPPGPANARGWALMATRLNESPNTSRHVGTTYGTVHMSSHAPHATFCKSIFCHSIILFPVGNIGSFLTACVFIIIIKLVVYKQLGNFLNQERFLWNNSN